MSVSRLQKLAPSHPLLTLRIIHPAVICKLNTSPFAKRNRRYTTIKELGRGAFGTVFVSRGRRDHNTCACNHMLPFSCFVLD